MSDLEPVGDHVDELLRRIGIPSAPSLSRLVEEWPELAGEPWGSVSHPVGFTGGALVIAVADGAHASLLRYHAAALVERLGDRLGAGVVESVRIRVESPKKGR